MTLDSGYTLTVAAFAPAGRAIAAISSRSTAKSVSFALTISAPPAGSACTLTGPVNPPGFVADDRPTCRMVASTTLVIPHASAAAGSSTIRTRDGSAGI